MGTMMKQVLLLNASEEIINVVSWKKAVLMLCLGKAHKPHGYDEIYEIQTANGIFELPKAIVLVQYVHIPYKQAAVTKLNVLKRDGYECAYCGQKLGYKAATVDHIIPRCRGGKHIWKNVVIACKKCNNFKDDKTPEAVGLKLRKRPTVPAANFVRAMVINDEARRVWSRWMKV